MMRRYIALLGVAAIALGVAGCAGFRNERQGRDAGRHICDIKDADNAEQAQRAVDKLNRDLDKARRITGRPVSEDVRDIQNNVVDLEQHAASGQKALAQQDVAVIRRNVAVVSSQGPELVQRFYEGVLEGLGNCT